MKFRGINAVNIDTKGRMAIPSRYRERLSSEVEGKLIVTIDTEQHCLLLYPQDVWEKIEEKIANLPSFQPATRRIQRLLIGHATEVAIDSHGRILLPPLLREYAHINKKVTLIGQGNKFEIWDEENWQRSRDEWISSDLLSEETMPDELKTISL